MIKKLLLSLASLFLLWQSIGLLLTIHSVKLESWVALVFVAWIINLFITGIFAFTVFAFPTEKLMPPSYYKISNPKQLKRLYNILKVDWFRTVLLSTLWKSKKQRQKYFNGKRDGISNLIEQSQKSEFGHLIPFIFISAICIYLASIGLIKLAIFTMLINLIGNLYPVILQRHHRMRIELLKKRLEKPRKSN